jgi:hypothetical protein
MPGYIVERTYPRGPHIPVNGDGAQMCLGVVGRNSELGVTWVHSYVSDDKTHMFGVYDGPDPESIRTAAERTGLPVDQITRVSVLRPLLLPLGTERRCGYTRLGRGNSGSAGLECPDGNDPRACVALADNRDQCPGRNSGDHRVRDKCVRGHCGTGRRR